MLGASETFNEFDLPASDEALGFLEEIAAEMILQFRISRDEAVGRICKEFYRLEFLTPLGVLMLLHETAEDWAKNVYFGRSSHWWAKSEVPSPQPYPRQL